MKLKKKQEIKHESAQVSCPFFELRNSLQKNCHRPCKSLLEQKFLINFPVGSFVWRAVLLRGGRGEAEGSTEQNIFAVGESEGGVMMGGWCRDQTFRELVLTKQLQKYILMTCHCPKAYETSYENIVSRSQTSCLPSPASSFFYTANQKPKL